MLTPEYLDSLTDDILGMYDALNEVIVEDIARRIVKTEMVTETAAWQAQQLQEMGALHDDILQRVAEVSGYTQKELKTLFEEAGVENIRYENDIMSQAGLMPIQLKQSESMLKLLKAGLDKTNRDLSNLTLTTALKAQSAYYDATNLAYMQVSSGVLSPQEAIKRAIVSTAKEGASVLYPSGHSDKIDVAVRRAVLTGVNQTAAKMSLEYCNEAGCDYVETTAHSGARPSHEAWQGQIFCVSGKDKKYRPFSDTGYGTGAGLCGWNCRHSFHAFFPGISIPTYTQEMLEDYKAKKYEYDGQELTDYECSQRQRSMERSIRETKRQLTACDAAIKATDDEVLKAQLQSEFESKAVRLKGQEAAMKDFTRKTDRRIDSSRVQVNAVRDDNGKIVGFNKSVSRKAVMRAEEHHKEWVNTLRSNEAPKTLAEYYDMKYNDTKKWSELRERYKILNLYESNSGDMDVETILKLDDIAFNTKMKLFTGAAKGKANIAVMEIDGDIKIANSQLNIKTDPAYLNFKGDKAKLILKTDNPKFETKIVGSHARAMDSEVKLFEYAATVAEDGKTHKINLLSEKCMCDSCLGVLKQFKYRYPNVVVNVVSNKVALNDVNKGKPWKGRKTK